MSPPRGSDATAVDPADFARAGTLIGGKYRVERVLGKGGMGLVLAARHIDLDQEVAIKMLLPGAAANADASARFLREGKAAARFASPHVAKVHDTGRLPSGEPYLVMEFLRGRDLKAIIDEDGRQPLELAIGWVLEAIEALTEAHAMGIVHRDIKPANIFLAETPTGRKLIKIVDFGISKQVDAANVEQTSTSAVFGSPLYMAPEQMLSAKSADVRADVWALGAVLYELTTGQTPFLATTLAELIAQVLQANVNPPSTLNPLLPAAFDAVVLGCLQKDRETRFQSVAALGNALREVSARSPSPGSAPVPERPAGPMGASTAPLPPPPPAVSAAPPPPTTLPAALPPSLAAQAASTQPSWQTTRSPVAKPQRSGLLAAGVIAGGLAVIAGGFALYRSQRPDMGGPGRSSAPVREPAVAVPSETRPDAPDALRVAPPIAPSGLAASEEPSTAPSSAPPPSAPRTSHPAAGPTRPAAGNGAGATPTALATPTAAVTNKPPTMY